MAVIILSRPRRKWFAVPKWTPCPECVCQGVGERPLYPKARDGELFWYCLGCRSEVAPCCERCWLASTYAVESITGAGWTEEQRRLDRERRADRGA